MYFALMFIHPIHQSSTIGISFEVGFSVNTYKHLSSGVCFSGHRVFPILFYVKEQLLIDYKIGKMINL